MSLFKPDPGKANGRFLGHLANGETREQLMQRYKAGELDGLNLDLAKANLKFWRRA